jgi:two-component system, LytTR family, response regulator
MSTPALLRVLIVDDEPLARRGIRAHLRDATDIEVVGEAPTGRDAVRLIRELEPDLVFLDIQMPVLDGFDVIEAIGAERMPITIFVTAYDEHALRAFDAHALDYLLKPLDEDRFEQALDRARKRVQERRTSDFGRKLAAVLAGAGAVPPAVHAPSPQPREAHEPRPYVDRLPVKSGGRVLVVPVDDINWIEAAGDYVRLHVSGGSHLLRERISVLADQLDPTRFARIHRSTIVNLQQIRELQPHFNREYVVVLKDRTTLKLSRGYRDNLESLFGRSL